MPDNPVIRVEADSQQVNDLIKTMQNANSTMKQSADAAKQLTVISKENASAQQLLNGEWKQAGVALTEFRTRQRETNQELSGYSNVIKQARQEHRLYMFAIMEGLHVFDGFVGKNKELTQALQSGAGAALGMKFALDAMGVAGSASGPIAILAGAISVLIPLLTEARKESEATASAVGGFMGARGGASLEENQELIRRAQVQRGALAGQLAGIQVGIFSTSGGYKSLSETRQANIERSQTMDALKEQIAAYDDIIQKTQQIVQIQVLRSQLEGKIGTEAQASAGVYSSTSTATMPGVESASTRGFLPFPQMPTLADRLGIKKVTGTDLPDGFGDNSDTGKTGNENFAQPLAKGFDVVGNAIEKNIVQKLGQANSVFQQFVQGFSAGLLSLTEQILSKLAIFELFSLLTGGEGFAGIGAAGELSKFLGFGGKSGTSSYSPNPNSAGGYHSSPVIRVEGSISHNVIAISNARGTKARTLGRGV